jgi:hypothetical protein
MRVAFPATAQRMERGERYVSLQPAGRAAAFSPVASNEIVPSAAASKLVPVMAASATQDDEALEFVRFCYRRRRVAWPALYDEMSVVAGRSLFRGMGYCELAERGISFCLEDLPRLVALSERVVREDQPIAEPLSTTISLKPVTA